MGYAVLLGVLLGVLLVDLARWPCLLGLLGFCLGHIVSGCIIFGVIATLRKDRASYTPPSQARWQNIMVVSVEDLLAEKTLPSYSDGSTF